MAETGGWYQGQRWQAAPKHVLSAAVIVLNDTGELLLVKSPSRGWEMPGGQVEQGEALTTAAVREVEEESGIVCEITRFCGIFQTVSRSICNVLFLGRAVGGAPRTSAESLEVGWFAVADALRMVTHENFRQRIERVLAADPQAFLQEYDLLN